LSIIISHAGTAAANGVYCPQGYYNGCIYYDPRIVTNYQLRFGDVAGQWSIMELGVTKYETTGNCSTDFSTATWTVTGGNAPAPQSAYGNCAPTPKFTPTPSPTPSPSPSPTMSPTPSPSPVPAVTPRAISSGGEIRRRRR
jgi:hypothetical protein